MNNEGGTPQTEENDNVTSIEPVGGSAQPSESSDEVSDAELEDTLATDDESDASE